MRGSGLVNVRNDVDLLDDRAYLVLKEAIISLHLLPGQHLPEREISEQLGISKTPIKYALIRLQREGFARQEPHRGVFVSTVTTKSILESSQLRQALEGFGVRLAARNPSPEALARLRRHCEAAIDAVGSGSMDEFAGNNEEFHSYFIKAMANSQYLAVWNNINDHLQRLRMILNQSQSDEHTKMYELFAKQHLDILESIEKGDSEKASARMTHHIGSFADLLVEEARRGKLPLIEVC